MQLFITSQKKNDFVNKVLRTFSKARSLELMQEALNILWNVLEYPKESFSNDKASL